MAPWLVVTLLIATVLMAILLSARRARTETRLVRTLWKVLTGK